MMDAAIDPASSVRNSGAAVHRGPKQIPGELGTNVLLMVFLALALYWTTPALFASWNYAGVWSEIGVLLFVALVASLGISVLRPLPAHLRAPLALRRNRVLFHVLWSGTLVAALLATSLVQLGSAAAGTGNTAQWTTTYTPFGAWPGLSIDVPSAGVFLAVNPPVITLLTIISVLWASVVVLRVASVPANCDVGTGTAKGWRPKVVAVASWGPVGFISGCPACSPAYLALLGLVAPGAAAGGYAAEPLVPWIGLAGLLFLGSLGLTLFLLQRSTRSTEDTGELPSTEVELA